MRRVAFAEQQPVAACACIDAGAKMRTQAGDAGAVADQDQWRIVAGRMEVAVAAQAQINAVADSRVVAEPAAGQARRAIRAQLPPQHQLQAAVAWHRCDRILTMRQRREVGSQCVGIAGVAAVGQMRHGKGVTQQAAIGKYRGRIEAMRLQPVRHRRRGLARADFGDVAGLPGGQLAVRRLQLQVEHLATDAAGIEHLAPAQQPGLVGRRTPVSGVGGRAAELAQQLLPMAQRFCIGVVDLHRVKQWLCTLRTQPVIELMAERTVLVVGFVAQCQHRVLQLSQLQRLWHHPAQEGEGVIGRITFAGGAGDEQGLAAAVQQRCVHLVDRAQTGLVAGSTQLCRRALGQLLGEPGLAGPYHQDRRFAAVASIVVALTGAPPQREAGNCVDQQRGQRCPPLRHQWRRVPPAFAKMQAQQEQGDQQQDQTNTEVAKQGAHGAIGVHCALASR